MGVFPNNYFYNVFMFVIVQEVLSSLFFNSLMG